jgi:hypothetical protein
VQSESSYLLEVVNHDIVSGHATIEVSSVATGALLTEFEGESSTRENPERALLTFQTDSTEQVQITLQAVDGPRAFDSITLRPNLIAEAGFDSGELVDSGPWSTNNPEGLAGVYFDSLSPYAGGYSACLEAPDGPNTLLQAPPEGQLADHEFYLFGAGFLWRARETPGVGIGNGSFFATGVPYEAESKAGAGSYEKASEWQLVGAAGRRLKDSTRDNHNDIVRFGSLAYGEGKDSDYCMDSAFTLKLDRINGFIEDDI